MFYQSHQFVRGLLVSGLFVLLGNLSGCASDAEIAAANGEQGSAAAGGASSTQGASATGIAIDSRWAGRPIAEVLNDASSPLSQRVFYFGFDSSSINTEDRETLTQHAEFLTGHPELTVTIEGHADERGSREYNLALGEQRARSVERLFSLLGVAKSQQQVVSFGEERPTALEHDESAWRFNRRVELLYSGY
jgi:peptidoglycan-associated lipoprotein